MLSRIADLGYSMDRSNNPLIMWSYLGFAILVIAAGAAAAAFGLFALIWYSIPERESVLAEAAKMLMHPH